MALDDHDGLEIGVTGARFGGGSRKRRKARPAPQEPLAPPAPPEPLAPTATTEPLAPTAPPEPLAPTATTPETTPETSSGAADRVEHDDTGPAAGTTGAWTIPVVNWPLPDLATSEPAEDLDPAFPVSVRVRPYVLTGGRTRTDVELALETLVSAGPHPALEHHSIVELCRWPISVAEVAALLGIPIGVARVVIGDLVHAGSLIVHAHNVQDVSDLRFLERVLTGLRAL